MPNATPQTGKGSLPLPGNEKKEERSVDLADESVAGEEDPGASLDLPGEKNAAGFEKPAATGSKGD